MMRTREGTVCEVPERRGKRLPSRSGFAVFALLHSAVVCPVVHSERLSTGIESV